MHERDPGHGLHGPVVEEEGEPAALVLLGRDELFRQTAALGLALLRLHDEARVLDRTGCEVTEHGRAGPVPALEGLRADDLDRPERFAADGERHDELAVRFLDLLARSQEPRRAGVEEALRLVAGSLNDLVRVERARDGCDGFHERLEEARLRGQLVLRGLVPAALGDDQVDGEGACERGGADEARGGERLAVQSPADRADDRAADGGRDEEARYVFPANR